MNKRRKAKTVWEPPSAFQLPPGVSVRKERISGQWVYSFRHQQLGELGRIVLQTRTDSNTQVNCELAGEDDPMAEERAAIFKPLALELCRHLEVACGRPREGTCVYPPQMLPARTHCIASKLMQCETCDAAVALLIFAEGAYTLGELEDYARLMYPKVCELNLPTWVIGEPVGSEPLPERPADILKIWPEREPVQRLRPDEFNALIKELAQKHCG